MKKLEDERKWKNKTEAAENDKARKEKRKRGKNTII